jgi:hypothetical protein
MPALPEEDGRGHGRRRPLPNGGPSFPKDEQHLAAPVPASLSTVEGQILSVCLRSRRDPRDIGILPALLSVERRMRRTRTISPP